MRALLTVMLVAGAALAAGADEPVVRLAGDRLVASWPGAGGLELRVTGPASAAGRSTGEGGTAELPLPLDESGRLVPGPYRYELQARGATSSGRFVIEDGQARFEPGLREQLAAKSSPSLAPPSPDDFVVADDLVVSGRTCSGAPCVNNEPFGSEDLRLKSSLPQLRFEDTDGTDTDWMLESAAGLFQLRTLGSDAKPLRVEPGAPTDSLHIDAGGQVGLGTAAPLATLHVRQPYGNASLGIEGFGGTVWNLESEGAGRLFVQGPNGGTVMLLNPPASPTQAPFLIESNGYVSLGGFGATAPLHLRRSDGATKLVVEEASSTVTGRNLLLIKNNGAATFRFDNTASGTGWGFGSRQAGDFFISAIGAPTVNLALNSAGNLTITGTLTQGSDRHSKQDVVAVEPREVLERVAELPIFTWRYKGDEALHAGPMAQDFHAAFGLGADDRHIAPGDLAGLGLAAVQALRAESRELWAELQRRADETAALRAELQSLREALQRR